MIEVRPDLDSALREQAGRFDLLGVAEHFRGILQSGSPEQYDDVLGLVPMLKESDAVVENGAGRMSFATIAKDRETRRFLVLAALFNCHAPAHLHIAGERTVNLYGGLVEHAWAKGSFKTERVLDDLEQLSWWDTQTTFHEPFTDQSGLAVVLYEQPRGLKLFGTMLKPDLAHVLRITRGASPAYFGEQWESWNDETARAKVAKDLGLAYEA